MKLTLALWPIIWRNYLRPYLPVAVVGIVADFLMFIAFVWAGFAPFLANGFSAILAALIVGSLSWFQSANRNGAGWGLRVLWLLLTIFSASVAVEFLAGQVGLAPILAKIWVVPFSFILNGFVFFRIGKWEKIG